MPLICGALGNFKDVDTSPPPYWPNPPSWLHLCQLFSPLPDWLQQPWWKRKRRFCDSVKELSLAFHALMKTVCRNVSAWSQVIKVFFFIFAFLKVFVWLWPPSELWAEYESNHFRFLLLTLLCMFIICGDGDEEIRHICTIDTLSQRFVCN